MSFECSLQAKVACYTNSLAQLESDTTPVKRYAEAAVEQGISLYLGVRAVRFDRNSVLDFELSAQDIYQAVKARTASFAAVSNALVEFGKLRSFLTWPGGFYIEDINVNTHLDVFQAAIKGVKDGNVSP